MRSLSLVISMLFLALAPTVLRAAEQYSFSIEEITFTLDGRKVVGTLTYPHSQQVKSIVLILHGMSGNREGARIRGGNEGLFEYTAAVLARGGIASLSISTGGRGGSEGHFQDMTLERRTREATKAVEWISEQEQFNLYEVSILGHSQGCLIAVSAAHRLAGTRPIASIILWAPQSSALSAYRRSMGEAVYQKGLNAKPDEVVSWIGATGRLRAFKRDFFLGLKDIRTLEEVEAYKGNLLVVTGKRDRWSTSINAEVLMHRHQGKSNLAMMDVGHRMGAEIGRFAVAEVVDATLEWLLQREPMAHDQR